MEFFLHYVGRGGAARDFPKTVFSERPTSLVVDHIPDLHPQKGHLLSQLGEAFPGGRWNCWGVPEGAKQAIAKLSPGDTFLLMESHAEGGAIPAMGTVEVYVPRGFPPFLNYYGARGGFRLCSFSRLRP